MCVPSRSSFRLPPPTPPSALLPSFPCMWKPRVRDSCLHFTLMVGDTPDFNEGQIGNTKRIASSHFSLLSFNERLWRYLPKVSKARGCGAPEPPGGHARRRKMWGAGRRYLRVKTALCYGSFTSPRFKFSPLASLLPAPPSEWTKEKKAVK